MKTFINSVLTIAVMALWAGMLSLVPAERTRVAEAESHTARDRLES